MDDFIRSSLLLFMLLNPFLLVVYLLDVFAKVDLKTFVKVILRAGLIALGVFIAFALLGDALFRNVLQARFASFQIFGGVIFLLIGIQFMFKGPGSIQMLQGESEHLGGAIAMPVLIGPGTISAAVLIGKRLDPLVAGGAILLPLIGSLVVVIGLKVVHDYVRPRHERLILRYVEITGRLAALYIGTVAVEMLMRGFTTWGAATP